MIYTVNLNPSFDHHLRYDENGDPYTKIIFGGKGNNAAKIISFFNKDEVFAVSFCDLHAFSRVTEFLDKANITHKLFLAEGRIREYNKIGNEHELYGYGIILDYNSLMPLVDFLNENLRDNDVLYLAGSLPQSCPKDAYNFIIENIKNKNVKILLDTRYEYMKYCLDKDIFAIKPNSEEILDFIPNFNYKNTSSIKDLVSFYNNHKIQHLLLSLGEDGVIYIHDGNALYLKSFDIKVLSTVGCGDTLFATFVYDIFALHKSPIDALVDGVALSTLVAEKQEDATMEEFLKYVEKIREINRV